MNQSELEKLINENKSVREIAKIYQKSFTTIKYWLNKFHLKTNFKSIKDPLLTVTDKKNIFRQREPKPTDTSHLNYNCWTPEQQEAYSFILGFFLGDGCLFKSKKSTNSYSLSFANQADFLNINQNIIDNLKLLFPFKLITSYKRPDSNCVNIKLNGIGLNMLFPYGADKKHTRKIELTPWQNEIINLYPKPFIKGLLHSDGCRYLTDSKLVYNFVNCSQDIHKIFHSILDKEKVHFTVHSPTLQNPKYAQKFVTSFYSRPSVQYLEQFVGPKN